MKRSIPFLTLVLTASRRRLQWLPNSTFFPSIVIGLVVSAVHAETLEAADTHRMAGPTNGPWRRLFLDATVVEQTQALKRVFHAAKKHERSPVIVADKPWEKSGRYPGPFLYGTVMRDQGKLRMWYRSADLFCHAESEDGINWTKPELGLYQFNASTENNIFLGPESDLGISEKLVEPRTRFHTAMIFRQPGKVSPEKRYLLFGYLLRPPRHRVAYSSDGLRWTFEPETARKGLFSGGDATTYGYDPWSRRYFAIRKTGSHGLGARRGGRGRAVGIAWSDPGDVLKWNVPIPGPVLAPDDLDPDETQFYNAPTFAYQGLFISQLWIYHARWFKDGAYTDKKMGEAEKGSPLTTDVQLAWSWDLINWTRTTQRKPFIPLGDPEKDEFDCGSIHTAVSPVVVGDRLFFYYGGTRGRYLKPRHHAIGLATLRLDGFCSMRAGTEEGSLITRREALTAPTVTINGKVGANGSIVAEILDRSNNVLDGFSREECVPFTGDSVAHTMRWRMKEFDPSQLDGDKKIRFLLRNADLYSYMP